MPSPYLPLTKSSGSRGSTPYTFANMLTLQPANPHESWGCCGHIIHDGRWDRGSILSSHSAAERVREKLG